MNRIVFYSGGISSYCTAKRVIESHGRENLTLLFTDTKYEHEDLYTFLAESVKVLGVTLTTIADGRNPWQVFRDVKFLGNSRIDPCSRILKRDLARKWIKDNFPDTENTTLYLGFGSDEKHRLVRCQAAWSPYRVESPLVDTPLYTKSNMLSEIRADKLQVPELYDLGFPHNNCGGFCVKAGMAHFRHLLKVLPEKYAECEAEEEKMRQQLGDVSILKQQRGGLTKPITLKQLRTRQRDDCTLDWGGCGCFADDDREPPIP